MKKIDKLINLAKEKTQPYVYSYFLPIFVCLINFLFWVANWQIVGLGVLVVLTCFLLITFDDFLPIIPCLFMIPMCFRNTKIAFQNDFTASIIFFAILFIFLVLHFIKYPLKKLVFDKFFFVIIIVLAMYLLTGVLAWKFKHYFNAIDVLLISGLMPLIIHFLLSNKVDFSTNIDHRRYFLVCFLSAATLACLQMVLDKTLDHFFVTFHSTLNESAWSNTNHIASLCLLAIPVCLYLMISSKCWWIYLIELVFFYVCVYVSSSDGGLATLLCFTPFIFILFYRHSHVKTKNYLRPLYIIIFSAVAIFLTYIALFNLENSLAYFDRHSSGTGRVYPYNLALRNFLKYPIFGLGLGEGKFVLDNAVFYNGMGSAYNGFYHSTLMHLLACCGLVGIAVYAFYYVKRIQLLNANDTVLGKFALMAFFMFAVYGMIENNEFNIVLLYMTTMITMIGLINKKGSGDKPLPLVYERRKLSSINNVSWN